MSQVLGRNVDQMDRSNMLLDDHTLDHLGRQMRDLYGPIDTTAAPQMFAELLAKLETVLAAQGEALTTEVRAGMMSAMPSLLAFARSLTRDNTRADDLVQETLLRGWRAQDSFQRGTNLEAWLFMIMRNTFYSFHRKRQREVEDVDGAMAERLSTAPSQGDRLDLQDVHVALGHIPQEQREALSLIVLNGMSYEEAAVAMDCKIGTVKSRVNRGRKRLTELLGYTSADLGSDRIIRSVTNRTE